MPTPPMRKTRAHQIQSQVHPTRASLLSIGANCRPEGLPIQCASPTTIGMRADSPTVTVVGRRYQGFSQLLKGRGKPKNPKIVFSRE